MSTHGPGTGSRRILRSWLLTRPADVVDVLVYVVVLNLTIELVPSVLSESFTISLLTAVLLKVSLEVVLAAKGAAIARLRSASTTVGKVMGVLTLWIVAAGSKLVILWLVDVLFGNAVSLGGFIPVTLLAVALLLSRRAVRWLLLGERVD